MRFSELGLTEHNSAKAFQGVTLFSPLLMNFVYLIGMDGEVLHQWELDAQPGNYAYLLPNGNLLVAIMTPEGPVNENANGGLIQELDWDGNVVWEYRDDYQHHDFRRCENGNTIYLGWVKLPDEHASKVRWGDFGHGAPEGILGDYVREVNPAGETVWEWVMHENIDIEKYPNAPMSGRGQYAHPNSIEPLPNGDVMVSWRHNNLIAVIDRQTGQFNFEWCGPELGHQHNFHYLENGNYMVFINQDPGPGAGSRVLEFDPKTKETVWEYKGMPRYTFHSPFISGAQRLPNGNTLICEGMWGRFFEVTPEKELVWEYVSPYFLPEDLPNPLRGSNCVFRANRYAVDGPEIQNRVSLT